jgi:hypothetical protein
MTTTVAFFRVSRRGYYKCLHAEPSIVFKWGVCRSLTEMGLDDLDPPPKAE